MMANECETIRNRFVTFLYDELPESLASSVRDHISHCATCASELDSLYKTREMVEWHKLSAPIQPLGNDFTERMWEAIEYRGIRQERPLWQKPYLWAALAAGLVISFGLAVNIPDYLGTNASDKAGFYSNPLTLPEKTPTPAMDNE